VHLLIFRDSHAETPDRNGARADDVAALRAALVDTTDDFVVVLPTTLVDVEAALDCAAVRGTVGALACTGKRLILLPADSRATAGTLPASNAFAVLRVAHVLYIRL
jgi:hypothetical protein